MAPPWNPRWQADTAYSVLAVVVPTDTNYSTGVFDGYTWRCTTAGVSGAVEPVWPTNPSITPTVTDGTVTWSVGTGFRQAIQSGVTGLVRSFALANPSIILFIESVRPRTFAAHTPCFFLGDLNETLTHMNGIRQRLVTGFSAYLVDNLGDQRDSNDRFNFAVDALTDLFTDDFHAISGRSGFEQTATNDTEFDENGVTFSAVEFQFARTFVAEGRN